MYMRISIVAALLLAACGDDQLDGRTGELDILVPKPGAFPAGKWTGELTSDHADENLPFFAGVRKTAGAFEVVLQIGTGPVGSFPAVQEGANLVVVDASLRDGLSCVWSHLDFERITFRREGGRLLGEGSLTWEEFEYDYFKDTRRGAATFIASPANGAPTVWNEPASVFHTPPGRFGTYVNEAVLLPDEVTIDLGGDEFAGTVEDAGSWSRNIRVGPSRPLPWGSTAVVRADVVDAAGVAHTLTFDLPTVAAPVADPDHLFSTLDGYATAGIHALSAEGASLLLGRESAFAGLDEDAWVLAFEAEVPDGAAPHLELDLVQTSTGQGWYSREPIRVTVASASGQPVDIPLAFVADSERILEDGSLVGDVAYHVDLSGQVGQRVFVALSSAGIPACMPWDHRYGSTVFRRLEVVP